MRQMPRGADGLGAGTWQVWPDRKIADLFSDTRRAAIPGAEEQIRVLLRLASRVDAPDLVVLDLGCGDALLLHALMRERPVRLGVAVDKSPAMLEKAQIRFEELGLLGGLVQFVEADFSASDWLQSLPIRQFDVVTAGFALQGIGEGRWREILAEAFGLLCEGGLLAVLDRVAAGSILSGQLLRETWEENLGNYQGTLGGALGHDPGPPASGAEEMAHPPVSLEQQLAWLREMGAQDVDCYWKMYDLALVAGYRR